MKKKSWILFLIAVVLGFVIWAVSPHFTHRREPWDSKSPYYVLSLLGAGVLAGAADPDGWKMAVLGIYLGQAAAILATSGGDLGLFIPMGAITLAFFTLIAAAGAFVAAQTRNARRKPQ